MGSLVQTPRRTDEAAGNRLHLCLRRFEELTKEVQITKACESAGFIRRVSGDGKEFTKVSQPSEKPKVIYTDTSMEFGTACEELSWNHCTSTPHRSETNGIAERAVRRMKEGTSTLLLQSGLDEKWWADSMECFCYLQNVQDLLSDGKTPYRVFRLRRTLSGLGGPKKFIY